MFYVGAPPSFPHGGFTGTRNEQRNGMKIRMICFSAVVAAFLCSFPAFCLDMEKEYKREIALYRIRPNQTQSLKQDVNGTPVTEAQLETSVRVFYEQLYQLDPAFFRRFKFKEVVFKDTVLDFDGKQYQHRKDDGVLFLDADLDDRQFYTNMFYLQIPLIPRQNLNRWNKLNPDGFSYESSRGNISGQAQKKLDAVLAEWDRYFVSRTGFYSTEMDMALTFAYMVEKGPDATAFVKKNSPTVQKKFDLLFDILETVKAVEPGYMQTLVADDLSKLKTYSPRALSVRLYKEFIGDWGGEGQNEESDGSPEENGEKANARLNAPVAVAGHKIVPLTLALEVNDFRLFSLLMKNKADPNAVNEKKVSALMLAISNNDPEEVKLLLEAGAKVSAEAARAGTAAGVNGEIVALLKKYLPGVKKSDAPEKKQTGKPAVKASGDVSPGSPAPGKLNSSLNEEKFDHFDLEDVALKTVFQLVDHTLTSRGRKIKFVIPPKYAEMSVTFIADDISLHDLLRLICIKTGLEVSVEEPDKVVFSEPKPGKKKTETRSANSPAIAELNRLMKEKRVDHLSIEGDSLAGAFQFVYNYLRDRDCKLCFLVPSQYEDKFVDIAVDDVSLYDLLQIICKKTGLEMSLDEPNFVIFEPKQTKKNAESKNGSAKKKP